MGSQLGCFCYFFAGIGKHFSIGKVNAKMRIKIVARLLIIMMLLMLSTWTLGNAKQNEFHSTSANTLLNQVAQAYQSPPVSARVDSVWKLIPALNGTKLNMTKTMNGWNAQESGATLLVFDQIPPAVDTAAFRDVPIYRGNPLKRQIALMFNVAWGEEYLPKIVSILKNKHVKATFFIDGKWASTHQIMLRELVKAGMELGNHGYQHHLFSKMSKLQMMTDLSKTNAIIKSITGTSPILFAPPAGDFNTLAVKVAAGLGMRTVLWTVDTVDWRRPQPEVIAMRVLMKKTPGVLVLMHPTLPTTSALPVIIDNLQKEKYQIVSVSELLNPNRPRPNNLQGALDGLRSP